MQNPRFYSCPVAQDRRSLIDYIGLRKLARDFNPPHRYPQHPRHLGAGEGCHTPSITLHQAEASQGVSGARPEE